MSWKTKRLRNIYIVDNMSMWEKLSVDGYHQSIDLVLTFDLELYKYIDRIGGNIGYTDHLVDAGSMEFNNHRAYDYFAKWNLDENGNDLLKYKGVEFGFSFRLEFWNDYISFIRLFLSAVYIKNLDFEDLYLCTGSQLEAIFDAIDVDFNVNAIVVETGHHDGFYFPIEHWLDNAIRPNGLRRFLLKAREIVTKIYGHAKVVFRKLSNTRKKTVFYQSYHPTVDLINLAITEGKHEVLLENFAKKGSIKNKLRHGTVPILEGKGNLRKSANNLLLSLKKGQHHRLIVGLNNEEFDLTNLTNQLILKRVEEALENKLRLLESAISYLDENSLDLVVLTANIGAFPTVFHLVATSKGIPSYMIINGLMICNYLDEGKYATYINSYSNSIKNQYFKEMDNVLVHGDPRMDLYKESEVKKIDRQNPTILIGASGFDSIDLNSYVAVEFDFLYDICSAIECFDRETKIIIKVRPNGYKKQYVDFLNKFFSNLNVSVIANQPMKKVLQSADLYISIYSQTLFEASCLGIPVLYYKKDSQVLNAPFDGNSELVTVSDIPSLILALNDFQKGSDRFDPFLDRGVMEKYVGPLDGGNLERNLSFINTLIEEKEGTL